MVTVQTRFSNFLRQCNFELESEDDFGDAHDKNTGFCNVVRKAEVVGSVTNERFVASSIKLVDDLE